MAGVFRRQMQAMSIKMIPAYLFHGVTAVLALFLLLRALGA